MSDALLYLTKSDLVNIERDGFIEINIRKTIEKGQWLRLEFDDDE